MLSRRYFVKSLLSAAALAAGHRFRLPAFASASGATATPGGAGAFDHLIVVYLSGGPSHIDTFDPKPGTRSGGPFRAIPTALPGVQFSEHLPRLAAQARRLVVVRNLSTKEGSHERAGYVAHSGFSPIPGAGFPSLGSTLSRYLGRAGSALPQYICLGGSGEGAGLHGPDHEPFVIRQLNDGRLPHVQPAVEPARLAARLALQRAANTAFGEQVDAGSAARAQSASDRAARLMATPQLAAFDHRGESAAIQAAYGPSTFGRHCLVARRLVEAGVTCVEIELGSWDGHKDNFRMHADLSAKLDTGLSALLDDLAARGLLDRTLILCAGEFGRSPSISKEEGRDHHPACFSAVLAGGGLRAGQVLGATDAAGEKVRGASVTFPDLFATLLTRAGIDPAKTLMLGDRPITLGNNGRVLSQLLAAR